MATSSCASSADLEADNFHTYDDDSAYEGSEVGTITTSLASNVRAYRYDNGRRYHAYREGAYPLPNDEQEQDRLDLLHHVFKLTVGGALFRAPIIADPRRILDFGTGTGIWALDVADEFPGAEVTGTDLSPIQPSWVPPNLMFMVDDVEDEWHWPPQGKFDFIHGRGMAGSIKDWPRLYAQCIENLTPGGWLEMQEYESVSSSDDGSLARCPYLVQLTEQLQVASDIFGKSMNEAPLHKQHLINAGFQNVRDDVYKVPIGPWPKDRALKELGRYQLVQICEAVEPIVLQLFTRVLQWSELETKILIAGVKSEFKDPKNHLYIKFHFIYGQKSR